MRSLIAYYSRRGENLVNGKVQELKVGSTELMAAILQKFTGADLFQIKPCQDYDPNYCRCIDQARQDLRKGVRPALAEYLESINDYDVIYLGYPNWWGTMPMPVFSFLEQYDFTDKILKPFCTHEGGGLGRSEEDIRHVCPHGLLAPGLSIIGADVKHDLASIEAWAGELAYHHIQKEDDQYENQA